MPKNAPTIERWRQKVEHPADLCACWIWKASTDPDGYGRFQVPTPSGQRHIRAHRWIMEYVFGPIPDGRVVMHLCDNPPCVNPLHLRIATPLENNADKVAKGRHAVPWGTPLTRLRQTHCKNGHPLEGDNLKMVNGHRICRTCRNANARAFYRRHKATPGRTAEVTVGRGHS